eukprot:COSAG01_NODE_7404_length_3220_cov_9.884973_2_plen_69_part_00
MGVMVMSRGPLTLPSAALLALLTHLCNLSYSTVTCSSVRARAMAHLSHGDALAVALPSLRMRANGCVA